MLVPQVADKQADGPGTASPGTRVPGIEPGNSPSRPRGKREANLHFGRGAGAVEGGMAAPGPLAIAPGEGKQAAGQRS